jgi:hypothetical protein
MGDLRKKLESSEKSLQVIASVDGSADKRSTNCCPTSRRLKVSLRLVSVRAKLRRGRRLYIASCNPSSWARAAWATHESPIPAVLRHPAVQLAGKKVRGRRACRARKLAVDASKGVLAESTHPPEMLQKPMPSCAPPEETWETTN